VVHLLISCESTFLKWEFTLQKKVDIEIGSQLAILNIRIKNVTSYFYNF
jgi:hypothetical protein